MSFVAYIISIPVAVAIGWMVWNYIEGNVKLDSRMKDGDVGLFDSSQYNISEVIRAPAGSIVEDVQTSPIPMTNSPNSLEELPRPIHKTAITRWKNCFNSG